MGLSAAIFARRRKIVFIGPSGTGSYGFDAKERMWCKSNFPQCRQSPLLRTVVPLHSITPHTETKIFRDSITRASHGGYGGSRTKPPSWSPRFYWRRISVTGPALALKARQRGPGFAGYAIGRHGG
jgi:hypothetical protein